MTDAGLQHLSAAIAAADAQRVRDILRSGCDVNGSTSDAGPPLVEAVLSGNLEIVEILIDAGAELNVARAFGEPPFLTPYEAANEAIRAALLDAAGGDEEKLFSDEGAPRRPCPFCRHWDWVACPENPCEHYVFGTEAGDLSDEDGGAGADVSSLLVTIEDADLEGPGGKRLSEAPESVRTLIRGVQKAGIGYWLRDNDRLVAVSATVPEMLNETDYVSYFHPDPAFRTSVAASAEVARVWLEENVLEEE